ncbi:hypothetical protein [Nitratireductor sp. OM-1]|uniref:hypothetical protein n=1 Tax=Nitratireductor sp. OM-1 TaxID=1756988 RepID=UPI000DE146AE|nr:hypothetical protein [Nitratireductor sp. OM-1]
MTVAAPLLTRRAVLQAAIEATYRDEAVVGVNDALYVQEPDYSVDVNLLERDFARDDLSPLPNIVGRRLASMTFTTELKGSGFQHSGDINDAPLISRLFRACGYSLTANAAPDSTVMYPLGTHNVEVAWAVDVSAAAHTELINYTVEVVTGGASGVAEVIVHSDTAGEDAAAAIVTDGQPITLGTSGVTVTPTWSGDLQVGKRWTIWAMPTGLRLDPISDNFESLTLVLNMDGVQHKMLGSLGTFSVTAEAGDYARIEWEFQGTFLDPEDVPMPICNYEKSLPSQVELARLRVDRDYTIVNAFNYTQGNDIQIRPDVSSKEGYVGTRIVSRAPEGGIDPEAELVANHDFWGKMGRADRLTFQMRVGKEPGNTVWFLAPSVQYTGLTYQDRNGIRTYDAQLRFSRVLGNDELCIVLI